MYVMAVNHDVQDYEAWKSVFDTFPPANGAQNSTASTATSRTTTTSPSLRVSTRRKPRRSSVTAPQLREAMGEAGVVGAPRVEIFEEVE